MSANNHFHSQVDKFLALLSWSGWFVFHVVGARVDDNYKRARAIYKDTSGVCAEVWRVAELGDVVAWCQVAKVSPATGHAIEHDFNSMQGATRRKLEAAAVKMVDGYFQALKDYEFLRGDIDWCTLPVDTKYLRSIAWLAEAGKITAADLS